MGLQKQMPRSWYVAEWDPSICRHCGVCVERCQFGAFQHDGGTVMVTGKERRSVSFDPEKCWGCGHCRNTCAHNAIVMRPLPLALQAASARPSPVGYGGQGKL
jgi:ferredoxin